MTKGRDKNLKFKIYLDAVSLLEKLSKMEPHLTRVYKFTLGRLMMDWAAQLVYKIDRMNMMHDKLDAIEDIAATVRTIESLFYILIRCHALPKESPVNEDAAALLFESIEAQARALWRSNKKDLSSRGPTATSSS
ncbi:MAG: hypothetical protein IJL28_10560 [Prevotella sp.]|nr:hypothetical protein [Prevotella sp.]MBQ6055728.1 hypothetical protein [Prevotella sp.]